MTRFTLGVMVCTFVVGCASTTPAMHPVEVKVPVTVPCRAPIPQRPTFAVDALAFGSGIWEQMSALRAERIQRQGYEIELEAAVQACQ